MSHDVLEILEQDKKHDETEVGNYFVANYPPFSYWDAETAKTVRGLLDQPQKPGVPLGVYFHVPFAGSAATSATSASTPTRMPTRSSATSMPASPSSKSTRARR